MSSYANNMPPSATAGAYSGMNPYGMQPNSAMPANTWGNNPPAYTSPAYAGMGCHPMPYMKPAPVYAAVVGGGNTAGVILVLFILLVIIGRALH